MFLLRRFADNSKADSLAAKLRRKRFQHFCSLIPSLKEPLTILDVGGTETFWTTVDPLIQQRPWNVVLLNLDRQSTTCPNIRSDVGDATCLKQYQDNSFDVVFSNSLIEHLGTTVAQKCMAAEVCRVGRLYYIQTPYKHFPLEAHSLVPFFQYMPEGIRKQIVTRWRPGWFRDTPDLTTALRELRNTRLLDEQDLSYFFPGSIIYKERIFGVTKSLVAHSTHPI